MVAVQRSEDSSIIINSIRKGNENLEFKIRIRRLGKYLSVRGTPWSPLFEIMGR